METQTFLHSAKFINTTQFGKLNLVKKSQLAD